MDQAAASTGDSRERILRAALELMAEYGYSGTSISMIRQRSGLPASSTYWHFGSKEGLLLAVVEDGARRWMASLPRWTDLEGEPRERLRALMMAAADTMANNPEPLRLLLLLSLERRHMDAQSQETIRHVRRSAANGFRLAFREIFSATSSPELLKASDDLAEFALAVTDGACIAHLIDPTTDLVRMFGQLTTAFTLIGDTICNLQVVGDNAGSSSSLI